MKRKLVKQGSNTLTISLPAKWVETFDLKQGDEVNLEEDKKTLVISTCHEFKASKSEINISGLRKTLAYVYLNNCYTRGDDEVKVIYDSPKLCNVISEATSSMIGYAIVEQGKSYCILKDLSGTSSAEFDILFRRILRLIEAMGESGLEAMKKKDIKSLNALSSMDLNVNKFTNYCLRSLNKKGYRDFQKTMHYSTILVLIEQLGDEYARLYKALDAPIRKDTLKLFEDVVKLNRIFSRIFHKYSKEDATEIFNKRDWLREITMQKMRKQCLNDALVLYRIRKMVELMGDILKIEIGLHI
ncbi:MAG: AbrB/MazE/SpoVT family DNA-binding domain-containing protein [Candidatus Woesearchaeota archaeon]